jgi:hypothetical protein
LDSASTSLDTNGKGECIGPKKKPFRQGKG